MLTELRKPERKKTLKKTIVKKQKPTIELGRVVETPEPTHKPSVARPKPRSPCPQRRAVGGVSSIKKGSGGSSFSSTEAKKTVQCPKNVFDIPLYDNLPCISRPASESSVSANPVHLNQKHQFSVPEDTGNHEKSLSLQRPQKKQPPLRKGALTLDRDLTYYRFSDPEIAAEKEKRIALTNQKPTKRPPLLRKVDNDDDETSSVSSVDQNNILFQNHSESSENLSSSNAKEMSRIQKLRDANKKKVIYPCQNCI